MPRFSRISWKRRDEAEPPRMESSSEAAKRRRSERAIPGAPTQTWYCSVSFFAKRNPGGGVFTSGRLTRAPPAGGRCWLCARCSIRTSRLCSTFPAAAMTTFPPAYICRWYVESTRFVTDEITSAVPITGRPRAWRPKTASENRSWTSSCGVSSYMAISSSTTSRSASSSEKAGANTMSVITLSAVWTCESATRAYTIVCSREVAAFSSPPSPSKISAICCAVYAWDPLKSRCSMKCETPAFASVSSREPAPTQKPSATERIPGTRSEMTRSPESSSDRTYFCIPPLSWPGALAGGRLGRLGPGSGWLRLTEPRHQVAVGFQQQVDEFPDLGERELGPRVWIEHRRVVGVVAAAGQDRLDGQRLHVHVRLDQRRELWGQGSNTQRRDSVLAGNAGHFDTAGREVVDETVVHDVAVERERLTGLQRVDDPGPVLVAPSHAQRRAFLQRCAQFLPCRDLRLAPPRVLVERDVEFLDELRPRALDEPGHVLGEMLGRLRAEVAELAEHLVADTVPLGNVVFAAKVGVEVSAVMSELEVEGEVVDPRAHVVDFVGRDTEVRRELVRSPARSDRARRSGSSSHELRPSR